MERRIIDFTVRSIPISINKVYRSAISRSGRPFAFMVKEGVDFKNQVGWIAKKAMQDAGVGLISTPFSLVVNYFFDPRREGDVTNYEKALIDGMKGIVFKDDRLLGRNKDPEFLDQGILFEAVFRKFFDKSNPRIEVMIVFYT